MEYLTKEEIISLNKIAVSETGESYALRDEGLLESAIGRPINHCKYENCDNVLKLGAILAEAILQNHVFEQGNKRTALAALKMFIERNGWELYCPDNDAWQGELMLKLTTHEIDADGLCEQISFCAIPYGSEEEPAAFEPFVAVPFEAEPLVAEPLDLEKFKPMKFDPFK